MTGIVNFKNLLHLPTLRRKVAVSHLMPIRNGRRPFSVQSCHRQVLQNAQEPQSSTESGVSHLDFPPFVKDLFVGKFNKSILSYAEVLNDASQFNLKHKISEVSRFLESKREELEQVDRTGKISPDIINSFKQSGLFGLSIPQEYGGAGFLNTEIARFYEEFGCELSLSEFMGTNEFLGYHALLKRGTVEQKQKYLPRLATGEMMATWCLAEEMAGSDPDGVRSVAVEDGEGFVISGTKTWVTNAQGAQLFTIFAKLKMKNSQGEEEERLTSFLVDKAEVGAGEMEISQPYELTGFRGLEVCDVKLDKCRVSKSAVLGDLGEGLSVLQSVLHHNKYMQAIGVVTNLRVLLDEAILHTNTRKQFGLPLSSYCLVRQQLAKMAAKLYSLESMVYLTAGLADASTNPDVELESVIIKQFAAETSDYIVSGCLGLFGAQASLETSKYQQYLRNNQVLQGWQGSANINKCFVGISGLMHLVSNQPVLGDLRQPINGNLIKSLKHTVKKFKHEQGRVSLSLNLEECVHPDLQPSARMMEWCVHKLHFVAQELLIGHGANIQVEEEMLGRLSDFVTEIFVMACTLSRASRSISLGLEDSQLEKTMVVPLVFESKQKVKRLEWECRNIDMGNMDDQLLHAGEYMTRRGGYMPVHPLTKNSF